MEIYAGQNSTTPGALQILLRLDPSDITGLSSPITIIQSPGENSFLGIDRIFWTYKFNSVAYNYSAPGEIYFKIADERVATLQADNLNVSTNNAAYSTANLCSDLMCPRVNFNSALTLSLSATAPTVGDGNVYIQVFYYIGTVPSW
jgi:hypothetical protein